MTNHELSDSWFLSDLWFLLRSLEKFEKMWSYSNLEKSGGK